MTVNQDTFQPRVRLFFLPTIIAGEHVIVKVRLQRRNYSIVEKGRTVDGVKVSSNHLVTVSHLHPVFCGSRGR
jgi:hypothetical protein